MLRTQHREMDRTLPDALADASPGQIRELVGIAVARVVSPGNRTVQAVERTGR